MDVEEYQRVNWNTSTTYLNPANLNNMDEGIKKNNEAIKQNKDALNRINNELNIFGERLFKNLEEDIDGRNVFSNYYGLSIFRVYTAVHAPKQEKEGYIVVVLRDWDFIQQTWYSLWHNEVYTRVCNVGNNWTWTDFRELTNI